MAYMIDARLERGTPSLTLIDAVTGEERLHWCGDNSASGECDWQGLFKRLILLSCADKISLVQRAKSATFSEECISCTTCVGQEALMEMQRHVFSTEAKNSDIKNRVASLFDVTEKF
ncbi:MAG: hypothetical protein COB33_011075 [Thiotrichaceae bacterium]|nr:hypothetical protein [Thiotrichaceae bacterium]